MPFYAIKSGSNNIPLWLSATSPNLGEEYMGYLVERSDLSPLTGGGLGVGNTLGTFCKSKIVPLIRGTSVAEGVCNSQWPIANG